MSNELMKADASNKLEALLINGDLKSLSAGERVTYYNAVCESVGLNPLTKPFEYMTLNGKLVLYARKDATEQLRRVHQVSVCDIRKEVIGDLLHVTVFGECGGRKDVGTGVVSIAGLKGESLANAYMKGETKAKRRMTLSICGLGLLDETEIEYASREAKPTKAQEVNAILSPPKPVKPAEMGPEEIEQLRILGEIESTTMPEEEPDFLTETAANGPEEKLGDFVIKIGQKHKGKKLSELSEPTLRSFVQWVEKEIKNKTPDTQEFLMMAEAYLREI